MYRALYRKWRPQTFGQVIGQEHITSTLRDQVKNDRLSHAYLFIGTRGTGKTTCARILARAVNCEHPVDGEPCGKCAACRGILDGSVVDVVELDAASNNGVDNVRALREEATFSPAMVKKRVYIIDEVHMLSTSAFNALLKILEEPPEHLMFILATTELHKVPATILSRCQRHSFRRVETGRIAQYLLEIAEKEQFKLTPDAADTIARLADGGVRDALSILDQCSGSDMIDVDRVLVTMGLAGKRRVLELFEKILRHDADGAVHDHAKLWMEGKDPASLLGELATLLRDVLMLKVSPREGQELLSGSFETEPLRKFARRITTEEALAALRTIQDTMATLRDTKIPRTSVELCLVALCTDLDGDSISGLRARISEVERQLRQGVPVRKTEDLPEIEEEGTADRALEEHAPVETYAPSQREADPPAFEEQTIPDPPPADRSVPDPVMGAQTKTAPEKATDPEPVPAPVGKEIGPAETEDPASLSADASDAAVWKQILSVLEKLVVTDVFQSLSDDRVTCYVAGDEIVVEIPNEFVLGRMHRLNVKPKLIEAASQVLGRPMRATLQGPSDGSRDRRSLDELRSFKEVHFIRPNEDMK